MNEGAARFATETPVSVRPAALFTHGPPAEGDEMNDRERHFVDLALEQGLSNARDLVDDAMATDQHRRFANRGSAADNSRWWVILSQVATSCAKAFITTNSQKVAAISTSTEAYLALQTATNSLLDHIGQQYERQYRGNRHFYSARDAQTVQIPNHWQGARAKLDLDLRMERVHFDQGGDFAGSAVNARPTAPADPSAVVEGAVAAEGGTTVLSIAANTPPGRGRRKNVGGLAAKDAPLVDQMNQLCANGTATSPWAAAMQVVASADGGGSQEAKLKRLTKRYYEKYPH